MRNFLFSMLLVSCGHATATTSNDTETGADVSGGDATDSFGGDASADAGLPPLPAPTITLPAACGVGGPQFCNPLDGQGCEVGRTCDLAADGTWQCVAAGDAVGEGATCSGLTGPFCGKGLTCFGTLGSSATCKKLCCGAGSCGASPCTPLDAIGISKGGVGICAANLPEPVTLGNQSGGVEGRGFVKTWKTWREALALQMAYYATACDDVGGYPLLASATHFGSDCNASGSSEVIPAMQDGTAILSYLEYDAFTGHVDPRWIKTALRYGDYLVNEAVTPNDGKWPGVFRSTGKPMTFPQAPDCGIRSDQPYEIEPDKLGIAGYALLRLTAVTGVQKYAIAALHNATVLAQNMTDGSATTSPWPFRVDYRDNTPNGDISGNMVWNLRLFDTLIAGGRFELQPARDKLWKWMRDVQIPNAAGDGMLWAQFFEDQVLPNNRTAWAPAATASYLLERREQLDPDWQKHAEILLKFVEANFVDAWQGFPLCIEQDFDRKPYGGVLSTYEQAEARYAALTGDADRRARAYMAIALLIQSVNSNGCPGHRALDGGCGGWQEDAHTDRVHNILAVLSAFPGWAD